MKFLKKRLPALLVALLIAVMPLFLAVPANANVLSGVDLVRYFVLAEVEDVVVFAEFPDFNSSYWIFAETPDDSGNLAFVLYATSSVSLKDGFIHFALSNSYSTSISDVGSDVYISDYVWAGSKVDVDLDPSYCIVFGSSSVDGIDVRPFPVRSSAPGILSVFFGVSSWLAGAVNNMISMFWTADVGLTPIGVLTVCSLALAVILLLFWLIAGWLKFK